jgi:hypothetical protein
VAGNEITRAGCWAHARRKIVDAEKSAPEIAREAVAVSYALSQWEGLNVFSSDGGVPIDNNVSEREMKRVVLNRKNSLFVGNARGGRTAAILASLTSSCRRHDVDPQRYLTQLLVNLPAARLSDLPAWLPDEWKRRQAAPTDSPAPA